MGRLNGFICGSVLSASIVYLSTLRMQSDYSHNSLKLQEYRQTIESLHYPPEKPRPIQARVARPNFVETLKDTWNSEIEGIVRGFQEIDWIRAREEAEEAAGNVWEKAWKKFEEARNSS